MHKTQAGPQKVSIIARVQTGFCIPTHSSLSAHWTRSTAEGCARAHGFIPTLINIHMPARRAPADRQCETLQECALEGIGAQPKRACGIILMIMNRVAWSWFGPAAIFPFTYGRSGSILAAADRPPRRPSKHLNVSVTADRGNVND